MRITAIAMILCLTLACSTSVDVPQVVVDESVCSECGMLVSDLGFAAAVRLPDGSEKVFDDPVCLLRFASTADAKRVWVHDHATDVWITGDQAVFIKQSKVRGPMGGDLLAAPDEQSARRAAVELGGSVAGSLGDLVKAKGSL